MKVRIGVFAAFTATLIVVSCCREGADVPKTLQLVIPLALAATLAVTALLTVLRWTLGIDQALGRAKSRARLFATRAKARLMAATGAWLYEGHRVNDDCVEISCVKGPWRTRLAVHYGHLFVPVLQELEAGDVLRFDLRHPSQCFRYPGSYLLIKKKEDPCSGFSPFRKARSLE